jgi:CSLREA domain-containing protein
MKKGIGETEGNRKARRTGLRAVALFVGLQVLAWVLFSIATPGPVEAATFTVNSTLDETDTTPGDGVCLSASGYCTLRAAIQEANALAGPDVIKLQTGLYMLTIAGISENDCATGDLDITDSLTITGKGAKNTFVNGGKLDRVFHINGPILVTIMNLSIQNGLATDDGYGDADNVNGGAILSASTLTLKGITISNNTASGGVNASGGGIYNWGMLAITKSTLFNNAASGGSEGVVGGAIYNAGTAKIISTTLSNNIASGPKLGFGGAILNRDIGILEIQGSTISNNTVSVQGSYGEGGGISNNGTLTIMQSKISNNTAQGVNGDGGGIANGTWGGQEVTITKSVISNNVARGPFAKGGGIVSFAGEVVITGSTLSYNAASAVSGNPGMGGGIFVGDYTTVTVRGASKILQNFSSDKGGGICYGGAGTGSVSGDSKVEKNVPDDIWP